MKSSSVRIWTVILCLLGFVPVTIGGGGGGGGGTTTTTTIPTTTTTITTTTTSTTTTTIPEGSTNQYSIVSVGTVRGQGKIVILEGIRKKTWAQYALWSDDNRQIYFKSGEEFYGHVHANNELWFSGDPEFFGDCTSASTTYGGSTNSCIFHEGFKMGPEYADTIANVDFADLLTKADLVITGVTQMAFVGTNIVVSNSQMGWNSHTSSIPEEGVIYIETGTGGGSEKYGDVSVSGTVDGRVTIVTDRDINITDNLTYADDSKTNSLSDDALGLISKRDIVVKPSCPNNVKIYAHMIATGNLTSSETDGSFGVENYSSGSPRGTLTVHGGIVQDYRGAVGTFNPSTGQTVTGYEKNYTYDTRFASNPPPEYPPLSNALQFGTWREQ